MRIYKIAQVRPYRSTSLDYILSRPKEVKGLKCPDMLQTLYALQEMGSKGLKDDKTAIQSFLGSGKFSHSYTSHMDDLFGNIIALWNWSRDTNINEFLNPFNTLMQTISDPTIGVKSRSTWKQDEANNDFYIMHLLLSAGGSKIQTTYKAQFPMFNKLYGKFKSEASGAANASGNAKLKSAIDGDGLIYIDKLFNSIQLGTPQSQMVDISRKLIQDISQKNDTRKFADQNFQIVKETLMQHFGNITLMQMEDINKQRAEQEALSVKKPTRSGPKAPPQLEKEVPYDVDQKEFINPNFLTALYAFFSEYIKYLNSLPKT